MSGDAKKDHSKFIGTYTLQRSPINGNPWWKQGVFGKKVIWFHDGYGCWTLTDLGDLGKYNAIPDIGGPSNHDEWPNYIRYGWRYDSNGDIVEAGNDIIIEGKQKHCCNNFKK